MFKIVLAALMVATSAFAQTAVDPDRDGARPSNDTPGIVISAQNGDGTVSLYRTTVEQAPTTQAAAEALVQRFTTPEHQIAASVSEGDQASTHAAWFWNPWGVRLFWANTWCWYRPVYTYGWGAYNYGFYRYSYWW